MHGEGSRNYFDNAFLEDHDLIYETSERRSVVVWMHSVLSLQDINKGTVLHGPDPEDVAESFFVEAMTGDSLIVRVRHRGRSSTPP